MRRIVIALIVVLLLTVALPVAAFELVGEVWSLTDRESVSNQIKHMNRAELTLINIGPVRLMGAGEYGGKITNVPEFINLIRDNLEEEKLEKLDDFSVIGGLNGRARVDWPLFNGISAIGSVGYQINGHAAKASDNGTFDITEGLYGGIIYGGGLGLNLIQGLRLSGVYEVGPSMDTIIGDNDTGIWQSWDVRLEYRIPLVLVRAGYRYQDLELDNMDPFRTSGFYVGAGFHF